MIVRGRHTVDGGVSVSGNAGQVVAGDSITHIEKYISNRLGFSAVAFFSALSAWRWLRLL